MDSILELFDRRLKENSKLTPKMKDILTASLELFSEKGYSNTSTRDISKAADVAEGTIFKHFGSKENLLYASLIPLLRHTLAADWHEQLLVSKRFIEEKSFRAFLDDVLADRLYVANENLKVMKVLKVLYTEYVYQGGMRENLFQLIPQNLLEEIDVILNYFKSKKEITDTPNKEILRLVTGILMTFVLSQEAAPTSGDEKRKEIERLLNFIAKGLRP